MWRKYLGVLQANISRLKKQYAVSNILDGEYDQLPEKAFYLVGSIDKAVERAKSL